LGRDVRRYIDDSWEVLTRSVSERNAFHDPKVTGAPVLYLPADLEEPPQLRKLQRQGIVSVSRLPAEIDQHGKVDLQNVRPGLLYLPNPYVVPGGQFNEMYGWDSYFIIRGLLLGRQMQLARGMLENLFFEVAHYGAILNANRTYYLTRSQPPLLTAIVHDFIQMDPAVLEDTEWLKKAYTYGVQSHRQWNEVPHLASHTGLSRYFDHGNGPVPEILREAGDYYRGVAHYFLIHNGGGRKQILRLRNKAKSQKFAGRSFPVFEFSSNGPAPEVQQQRIALTADYYKGDRSMRESGFDVSFRFGAFSGRTHHFAPVCLNSLLFKTETDLVELSELLGKKADAAHWRAMAGKRRERIERYLWSPGKQIFFDYDTEASAQSTYCYATTFYPLWAGLATPEQAQGVAQNLKLFEEPGGVVMSRHESQAQWDYPYGWAPLQLLAIEGLDRYGYRAEARRIAAHFVSLIEESFEKDGTIREKYDVVARSADTEVHFGYTQNEVGFGWTNGVYLALVHFLEQSRALQTKKNLAGGENQLLERGPSR
jgi:alpha,alpha-trehalase